ncbi:malonate decarboxylase holo-ACP synthase [Mycobacterium sp. URHB0044]|uniref:malonate decarboxylase holo-ACP synthase n=1 Tax=Mycobacterium sp. URHB0044 TaxID=1380386 RepID=UPI00048BB55E|nr:malonate decarboxylase holo-ACP synthase [Mycobacterium sp. URHB0044]
MTSPRPHDLLRVSTTATDVLSDDAPSWVKGALQAAPWVVVRRAFAPEGLIAVGVRGRDRSHRYAWAIQRDDVRETVAPEDLADVAPQPGREVAAMRALSTVRAPLIETGLVWGPTGSVGFELASGTPTATPDSDLDLVIRVPSLPTALDRLDALHRRLSRLNVRIDCQVETHSGAIALAELLSEGDDVLVKTPHGPSLVRRSVAVS